MSKLSGLQIDKPQRNQSIELLRTLSMFSIVIIHFYTHGLFKEPNNYGINFTIFNTQSVVRLINYLFSEYIHAIVCVSVNCYVFITGYFLIEKKFKIKRIINTWFTTLFYSVIVSIFLFFTKISPINITDIVKSLFPITFNQYWFVTNYIGLIALSPFINILCKQITKQQLQFLLVISFLMNMTIFIIFPWAKSFGNNSMSLSWFICLYLTSAYLRLYGVNGDYKFYLKRAIALSAIIFIYTMALEFVSYYYHSNTLYHWGYAYNSLEFFLSILVFIIFLKFRFTSNSVSNFLIKISPYTFGVYLIHDNCHVRNILWNRFDWNHLLNSEFFILQMIVITLIIFGICIGIDYGRERFFRILRISDLLDVISKRMEKYIPFV